MAAPLSGVGQQQQTPITQSLQPGIADQARQVRSQEQQPKDDQIQARGASLNKTLQTNQDDSGFSRELKSLSSSDIEQARANTEQRRGSFLDITV